MRRRHTRVASTSRFATRVGATKSIAIESTPTQSGQTYIAGVSYWTGLSCEDYNLWMRIDSFLPFLDLSYKRGGQDVLKPTFACVTPNPHGSLTAIHGYQNDDGVAISVPYGTKNASARDTSGVSNWSCDYVDDIGVYGKGPQPVACTSQQDAYTNCLLGG